MFEDLTRLFYKDFKAITRDEVYNCCNQYGILEIDNYQSKEVIEHEYYLDRFTMLVLHKLKYGKFLTPNDIGSQMEWYNYKNKKESLTYEKVYKFLMYVKSYAKTRKQELRLESN